LFINLSGIGITAIAAIFGFLVVFTVIEYDQYKKKIEESVEFSKKRSESIDSTYQSISKSKGEMDKDMKAYVDTARIYADSSRIYSIEAQIKMKFI